MWISRFQVASFSSFSDTGWIDLDRSFNLFIGQNNSGKSALLKALNFPLAANPHKQPNVFRGQELKPPVVDIDIKISPKEFFGRLAILNAASNLACRDGQPHHLNELTRWLADPDTIMDLEFRRTPNAETAPRKNGVALAKFRSNGNQALQSVIWNNGAPEGRGNVGGPETSSLIFSGAASDSFFYFDAQRLNIGKSGWNSPQRLLSNAGNLAAVLAYLQGARRPVFDLIERHVIDVLGGIDRITVAPRPNNEFEVLLWPDRSSRFEELAFSLDESGTGVGQLLAIVAAMVTSEQSIFIIDEINSFLHPAAVKRLLSLIRADYNHHQYIISTHSADVIANAAAEKIYMVKRDGFDSNVSVVSLADAKQAKEVSSILGFSMMDVFGHERVIWVEGPTEETCFPYLARRKGLLQKSGIGFAPVHATAPLVNRSTSRSATLIYEQAGKKLAPLLKGMAFALDRETLSDAEVAKLERSRRKLKFLPRRCMECYLIHPEAIASVLSTLDTVAHSSEDVIRELQIGGNAEFGAPRQWTGHLSNAAWLKRVDAARLLARIFTTLSQERVEYRKTRDGISLLKFIAENDSPAIMELEDFIGKIIEVARRDTAP